VRGGEGWDQGVEMAEQGWTWVHVWLPGKWNERSMMGYLVLRLVRGLVGIEMLWGRGDGERPKHSSLGAARLVAEGKPGGL
jgi:hypothetical protein